MLVVSVSQDQHPGTDFKLVPWCWIWVTLNSVSQTVSTFNLKCQGSRAVLKSLKKSGIQILNFKTWKSLEFRFQVLKSLEFYNIIFFSSNMHFNFVNISLRQFKIPFFKESCRHWYHGICVNFNANRVA